MSCVREVLRWTSAPDVLDIGRSGQHARRSDIASPWWLHGQLLERFPDAGRAECSQHHLSALSRQEIPNIQGEPEFCLSRRYVAIIAGELIEHLTNPETFLNCAIEHFNPSGRIRMVGRLMSTFGRILNSRMGFNNMLFALRREASEEVFTHSHVEAS